jgi:preprotein translocase subunit SecE
MINTQRIVNVGFGGLAIVLGIFVRQIADLVWGITRLPMPQSLPFAPADAIGFAVAAITFFVLRRHQKANMFTNEVVVELSKVTWPPKKETLLSTVVVSVMVGICAVILFAFDTLWGTAVKLFYQ